MTTTYSKYPIDIVFVIDVTGSMGDALSNVKKMAIGFHKRLNDGMIKKTKEIETLRARIITFRDLFDEGEEAIKWTKFFNLPEENEDFCHFINGLEAAGGGDEPESALEALWLAIRSPWRKMSYKSRQIIVLFTDASAHPVSNHKIKDFQDSMKFPTSIYEIESGWGMASDPGVMSRTAKRLLVFAPEVDPWTEIENWENTTWYPSAAGAGCGEYEMEQIVEMIAGSV
jgi:hypothetical protein